MGDQLIVLPGGHDLLQKPHYYTVIKNGKRIRVFAHDLKLSGLETKEELNDVIHDYLSAFVQDVEIVFQLVN
jgi:hypothetical protein